jgi:16S rRNA pseudouridine516 synthase
MKLDRLIAKHEHQGRTIAHRLIAARRVKVDGAVITNGQHEVDRFMGVTLDDMVIQQAERALHVMLHKPVGVVSATKDAEHTTVVDLIDVPGKESLHLAGRLDRSTSGLVLLTNDGRWSKQIMNTEHHVAKVYLVETAEPFQATNAQAFAEGFYFHTEDITTLPAKLEILEGRRARLTLHEGRYHQVKRMFHRVGNRVTALHRESVGALDLGDLKPGEWRMLTDAEVRTACASATPHADG